MAQIAQRSGTAVDGAAQYRQELHARIHGVLVHISGLPPALRARLADLMSPFDTQVIGTPPDIHLEVHQDTTGVWTVTQSHQSPRTFSHQDRLLSHLEWRAASSALELSQTCVAFHAAALARDSSVILLLGTSGSGKSTLTLGLMSRGWMPLSDDVALVNKESLAVEVFPRSFHIEAHTRELVPLDKLVEPSSVLEGYARPLQWAPGQQRPTSLFIVHRCSTCPSSRSVISQAEAAGALLTETIRSSTRSTQQATQVAVGVAASTQGCYRVRNGQLDGTLNLIERAVR